MNLTKYNSNNKPILDNTEFSMNLKNDKTHVMNFCTSKTENIQRTTNNTINLALFWGKTI